MNRAALAAAFLFAATRDAAAHTAVAGIGGFTGGLLHPLLVPAHMLALFALGLLAGRLPPRIRAVLMALYLLGAMAAFAVIAMAVSTTQSEAAMLCLAAVAGGLLATGLAPISIVAAAAIAVSAAVMMDSVPAVPSVSETALSLAGTAFSSLAVVAAVAWCSAALPQHPGVIAVRIAGSWIAASAVLALALRFAA